LADAVLSTNHRLHQVTLLGTIIEEEKFYVIGFVPASVVRLGKEIWFMKLDYAQIDSADQFLSTSGS